MWIGGVGATPGADTARRVDEKQWSDAATARARVDDDALACWEIAATARARVDDDALACWEIAAATRSRDRSGTSAGSTAR